MIGIASWTAAATLLAVASALGARRYPQPRQPRRNRCALLDVDGGRGVEKALRIDRLSGAMQFEMEMGSGRQSRCAGKPHQIAPPHALTPSDREAGKM